MTFHPSAYGWLLLAGIAASLFTWTRLARGDSRLVSIYLAALLGAFIGAKLVYLLAEGWLDWPMPDRWVRLATGKSVLGALLGGYAGVELAKKLLGYTRATGDWFAIIVPLGIALGRVGCLLHGCCLGEVCDHSAWWTLRDAHGVPRWPAVPLELAFNVAALAVFVGLRRGWFRVSSFEFRVEHAELETRNPKPETAFAGQLFHLYLIAYGLFRFAHEWVRATPKLAGLISGYQLAALVCVALGAWGWRRRARLDSAPLKVER